MTLLGRVVTYLDGHGAPCALIGGGAMAVHGVSRATEDMDLLTVETRILEAAFWSEWPGPETPSIRNGDPEDPLAGVVRINASDSIVDVVVGREAWMPSVVARRAWLIVSGEKLPVVDAVDLVLTKLAAGGSQDLLDVQFLLGGIDGLRAQVEQRLRGLPATLAEAWSRIPG